MFKEKGEVLLKTEEMEIFYNPFAQLSVGEEEYLQQWAEQRVDGEATPLLDRREAGADFFPFQCSSASKATPLHQCSSASKAPPLRLRTAKGEHVLDEFPYLLGKKPGVCQLILQSPAVSRQHARITRQEEDCFIEDCQSTNGTFLNGQRLGRGESRRLCQGDVLRLADVELYCC